MTISAMTRAGMALLAVYLSLAAAYVLAVPPWEAPDEPAHFLYIQHLAATGEPPPPSAPQTAHFWQNGYVTSNYEWHQPPAYYALGAGLLAAGRALGLPIDLPAFPPVNPGFPTASPRLFMPTADVPYALYALRFLSLLLGLGTLWQVYLLAGLMFPGESWLPELAMGLTAFIPQFTFLHAYVSNDAMAVLVGSAGLLALARLAVAKPMPAMRTWIAAGLILSLAIVTKITAFFLLPLALGLLFDLLAARKVRPGSLALAFAGLICLPAFTGLRWPAWLAHFLLDAPTQMRYEHMNFTYLLSMLPLTHHTFWGLFGWSTVGIPSAVMWLLDIGLAIGLVAAGVTLVRRRQTLTEEQKTVVALLLTAPVVAFTVFVLFNMTIFQPQSRLFYPALSAITLFSAYGWLQIAGRRRGVAAALLLTGLLLLNLGSLLGTLLPAYR